jgi:hypothetical protein
MKLPQLRKSKLDAFGGFLLMISTSCLDKPSDKTCSTYPQFQQARRRVTLTAIIANFCVSPLGFTPADRQSVTSFCNIYSGRVLRMLQIVCCGLAIGGVTSLNHQDVGNERVLQ